MLKKGSRGTEVKKLQEQLNKLGYNAGAVDGIFGSRTESAVKAFQKDNGLAVDGIVGAKTQNKLNERLRPKSQNGNVKQLQEILTQIGIDVGKIDGVDGPKTRAGIRQFQKIFGLAVDGIAGPKTWAVLDKAKNVKHFKVREFACKHCGEIKIDINLLVKLEELRRAIGNRPIIINSGYRCPTHNRNVGGAKNSQHMYGKAVDIRVNGMSPRTLEKYADTVFNNGGVGMGGATIVHVDTRGHKARWRYN
jgi:peptidoglycan hydrolase-like protein with peptidoglycan-binding domain